MGLQWTATFVNWKCIFLWTLRLPQASIVTNSERLQNGIGLQVVEMVSKPQDKKPQCTDFVLSLLYFVECWMPHMFTNTFCSYMFPQKM